MKILMRKTSYGHNNLFEWTINEKRWYPINYKHIVAQRNGAADPIKALEPFREAINKMRAYAGFFVAVFEAQYDAENRRLEVEKPGDE
jgi:hypothetical protein